MASDQTGQQTTDLGRLDLTVRPTQAMATAYEEGHQAVLRIIGSLADEALMVRIPACPDWTVQDLVAHMTGIAVDATHARFPVVDPLSSWEVRAAAIDAFTAGHVTSRRGRPIDEIVTEWSNDVPSLVAMLSGEQAFPTGSLALVDWMVVGDVTAHCHDLRGAVGMPGDRDSIGVGLAVRRYLAGLEQRIDAAGLPALRVCTGSGVWTVGTGTPRCTLTASNWELFRALSSRRSRRQISALDWSGEHADYLPLFPAYGLPAADFVE